MAQVAQQDPSTTAPKEPSISVDDTTLTQPLVPERIAAYKPLRGESLSYPTHQFSDRSRSAKVSARTMQSSHPPEDKRVPSTHPENDRDRFRTNPPLHPTDSPIGNPPPRSNTNATKAGPLSQGDPGRCLDDSQPTTSLYHEASSTTGDFAAAPKTHNIDHVKESIENDEVTVHEPGAVNAESEGTVSIESTQRRASLDEASDSTHGDAQGGQIQPELSEASPPQPVPLDQFPPSHGVYNMVASFGEMTINPMQYGGSVPMIPMQPPPPISLSPQQAAQVAHHQRQQQQLFHQQPQRYQLWVPQERVGAVIGGQGTVIRALQERSGATIQVHNDTISGDHKLFTIFGTMAQYEAAAQLVNQIVERPRPSVHGSSSVSSERSHYSSLGDPSRGPEMCKTVYVPSRCVGLVIGRNGETIRSLQDKSGALIKVTRNEEAVPGAEQRSILISGTEEAIAHAHQLVSEIVMVHRSPHLNSPMSGGINGQPVVEMLAIPNDKVGLIIGKKGATIRDLQIRSGAKIQVTKDDNCVQSDGSRPVTITGIQSHVDEAKAMIANKINLPMLPAIPTTAAFAGGARPTTIPPQAPGQTMPYMFPSHMYEGGFQNGQETFPQTFDQGDPSSQNRAAMAYVPYMGYNNYAAMGQHPRNFQQPVPMQYTHPQQAVQEQQGMQVPSSDQQDPNVQSSFHSPSVKPGQPMELPGSPTMLSRDANGGIVMYPGHGFPQLAQISPQHQMFPPPPPNSRIYSHREQAHAAQVQVQAQAQAQLFAQAQAQAQAQVQATQAQARNINPQSQTTTQTQAQVQAQVGSEQPVQTRSSNDGARNQQARAPDGEQSGS